MSIASRSSTPGDTKSLTQHDAIVRLFQKHSTSAAVRTRRVLPCPILTPLISQPRSRNPNQRASRPKAEQRASRSPDGGGSFSRLSRRGDCADWHHAVSDGCQTRNRTSLDDLEAGRLGGARITPGSEGDAPKCRRKIEMAPGVQSRNDTPWRRTRPLNPCGEVEHRI